MVFDTFIRRRRWRHADAGIRRQAVAELEPGHPALRQLACADPDMGVRRAALARIDDFEQVLEIGLEAEHRRLREAAAARLCGLLGAQDEGPNQPAPLDVAACLERLESVGFTEVAAKLCRRGKRPETRLLALSRVRDPALLLEIACEDPAADVRYAAVIGIRERTRLEQVLRQTRKKDKRVARYAKDRLDAFAARERALHRMAELCTALEALRDSPTDDLRVKRLLDEADPLRPQVNDVLRERLEQAHENWLEGRARHERQKAEWAEAVAKHESLLESMEQLALDLEGRREWSLQDEGVLEAAIRTFEISWHDADPLPEAAKGDLNARYRAVRQRIGARREWLREQRVRVEALLDLERQARAAREADAPDCEATLAQLRAQAAELPWPQDPTLHAELTAQVRAGLGEPQPQPQPHADDVYQDLETQLPIMETAVERGEAQAATRAESRIKALLGACPPEALATRRGQRLEARWRAIDARLRALRDWRRWGSGQAREALIQHMETLPDGETDPETLAKAIREARRAWQRMDRAGDRPEAGLWERFDQACTQAYAPCAAHFEAKAQERAAHLAAREAVVTALDALAQATDWDAPDWKTLDHALRDLKRRWREAGQVDRNDWVRIEARYKAGLAPLEGPLREAQARNRAARERLIAQVEALAEATDLPRALDAAKRAQREWRVTAPLGRKQEQRLWERFRAACDAVFARRQQARAARDQVHLDNLAAKQALCAQAEALSASDTADMEAGWRELDAAWKALGPVPKAELRALETRWSAARTEIDRLRLQRRLNALREPIQTLKAHLADLSVAEEALLASESAPFPASLEGLDEPTVTPRLNLLRQALEADGDVLQAPAAQAAEAARTLCIHAEILAACDSPAADAEQRLQVQVARLQQAMGEAPTTDPEARALQAVALERQWLLLGPLTRTHRQALGDRMERALAMIWTAPTPR